MRDRQEAELGAQEREFVEVPSDCKSARLSPNGVSLASRVCPLLLQGARFLRGILPGWLALPRTAAPTPALPHPPLPTQRWRT